MKNIHDIRGVIIGPVRNQVAAEYGAANVAIAEARDQGIGQRIAADIGCLQQQLSDEGEGERLAIAGEIERNTALAWAEKRPS